MSDARHRPVHEAQLERFQDRPGPDEEADVNGKLDFTGSIDARKKSSWNQTVISSLATRAHDLANVIPELSGHYTLDEWRQWFRRRVHLVLRGGHEGKGEGKEKQTEDREKEDSEKSGSEEERKKAMGKGKQRAVEHEDDEEKENQEGKEEEKDRQGDEGSEDSEDGGEHQGSGGLQGSGGSRLVKYDRRLYTAITMSREARKQGDRDGEKFWQYVNRSVRELQLPGMSDDEDGKDEDGKDIKLVHQVGFRHPGLRDVFEVTDQARYHEPALEKSGRPRPRGVLSPRIVDRTPPNGISPQRFRPQYIEEMKIGEKQQVEFGADDYLVAE
ncbi:hypothetical protein AAF712_013304 [Marasmius tenuissimus]|uniref:Uncharacterized protein n=1 Tax=Marasmius tenuissimus TaxID=585030 RepID=A0ABR2ZFX3_9AGAR